MDKFVKEKIFIIVVSIPFLCYVVLHFSHALPSSLITDTITAKAKVFQDFSPQGFGFYSKPPTEKGITFESEHLQLPTAIPENFIGLSRFGRAQAIELGKIYEEIPKDYWLSCETEKECTLLENKLKPYVVKKNDEIHHLVEGEYLIKSQEPISWYFRDYKETTSFEREIAKVVVE
ncbi:SdpA family antimicrobial peptide system protein [Ureibacillus sp. Re31]|uniref:SdpA family antimicrobial peptide system protein n=1 Tax=Ureibacillus galli TaxID=2762222 RepID=A0ABR8XE79_9BACL|nr:SdpA family antimicrobial peptide system protein [Ureibacillus galli]MBD8027524.1 SdpA family antimicrobial peptide system protein [Ureibacillus galli]